MKNIVIFSCAALLSAAAQAAPMNGSLEHLAFSQCLDWLGYGVQKAKTENQDPESVFNMPTHRPRILSFNMPTHRPRILVFNMPTHRPGQIG